MDCPVGHYLPLIPTECNPSLGLPIELEFEFPVVQSIVFREVKIHKFKSIPLACEHVILDKASGRKISFKSNIPLQMVDAEVVEIKTENGSTVKLNLKNLEYECGKLPEEEINLFRDKYNLC